MSIEDKIRSFARASHPPTAETRHRAIELVDLLRGFRIYNISPVLEGKTIVLYSRWNNIQDDPMPIRWTILDDHILFDWKEDWED